MNKLNRREFLINASIGTSALLTSGCLEAAKLSAKKRPNIIFLMDDQHRWDAFGFINPAVQTPNLDALAKSGLFFDQATCQAPMCVPSRNSMMYGLYPNQLGIVKNGGGVPDEKMPTKPLAQMLKDAGYQTAGFGKTHWGLVPSTRGFETRYAAQCEEKGAVMMKDDAPQAKKRYDAESKTMGGGEENNLGYLGFTSPLPEEDHRDGWVTKQCLNFIENGIDHNRPLFMYLSFLKPHAGHNVPVGYEDKYDLSKVKYAKQPPWQKDISPHALNINRRQMYIDYWSKATDKQWRLMTMRYRANCTWIDDMFGRAIKALKSKGILDNALIIYCSDHGEMLGERYFRFNKYCLYESSVRVPLMLSGTALPKTLRGKRDHRPAELVDLYPTILKAANIKLHTGPAKPAGLNLLSTQKRKASFCALHEGKNNNAFMWRTGDHKLILIMKGNRKTVPTHYTPKDIINGEFYNLKKDPQEFNDLYSDPKHREIIEKMKNQLLTFLKKQHKLT